MTSSLCGRGELPLRSAECGGLASAARGLRTPLVGMARRPPFLWQLLPSLPTPARPSPPPPALHSLSPSPPSLLSFFPGAGADRCGGYRASATAAVFPVSAPKRYHCRVWYRPRCGQPYSKFFFLERSAIQGANCQVRSGFGVPRRIWLTEGCLESCCLSLNRRCSD